MMSPDKQQLPLERILDVKADDTISSAGSDQVLPPVLELTIVEQPAEFYRFRYPSEITHCKLGGMLLGRSSTTSSKSFIKARISGIDPRHHSKLQLTVCTVSPDKAPHPYYLHGDLCQDGYYKWEKTVDERTQGTLDVTLDQLAVICVSKKADSIRTAVQKRHKLVPQFSDCPTEPSHPYDKRNLDRIRLAFELSFSDSSDRRWTMRTSFSDEISDNKYDNSLVLDDLNPNEVSPNVSSELAIYVRDATAGIYKNEIKVHFTIEKESGMVVQISAHVQEMKKHLLVVETPSSAELHRLIHGRTRAKLTVHVNDSVSNELFIYFNPGLRQSSDSAIWSKKRRRVSPFCSI